MEYYWLKKQERIAIEEEYGATYSKLVQLPPEELRAICAKDRPKGFIDSLVHYFDGQRKDRLYVADYLLARRIDSQESYF